MKQIMRSCGNSIARLGEQAMPAVVRLCALGLLCALWASCENKWPRNGDLDGQWQLLTIEHGGIATDVKAQQRYLSFQLDLCQLSLSGSRQRYYSRFDHSGDQITFHGFADMAENDTLAQDNRPILPQHADILHPWGHYAPGETFRVERLTGQDLVLRSDSARITYRKF